MKMNRTSVATELLIAAALCLAFATGLRAQEIVVFAKGDSLALGPGVSSNTITNPAKAAFLDAVKADWGRAVAFGETNKLTDFPTYGRNVAGAGGEIDFRASFKGGFVVAATLEGLLPNHKYNVKDTADFKIVLYHDFFKFAVE